jgi:hypothetical protein
MSTTGNPPTSLAQRFVESLTTLTPDPSLYSPSGVSWHNFDQIEAPLGGGIDRMRRTREKVPDFTFSEVRYDTGIGDVTVVRYFLTGTLPDGSLLRVPGVLVVTEADGVIVRSEEYLDTAQLAPLAAALAPQSPSASARARSVIRRFGSKTAAVTKAITAKTLRKPSH